MSSLQGTKAEGNAPVSIPSMPVTLELTIAVRRGKASLQCLYKALHGLRIRTPSATPAVGPAAKPAGLF